MTTVYISGNEALMCAAKIKFYRLPPEQQEERTSEWGAENPLNNPFCAAVFLGFKEVSAILKPKHLALRARRARTALEKDNYSTGTVPDSTVWENEWWVRCGEENDTH